MRHKFLEVFGCCLVLSISARAATPVILSPPQSITVNNASAAAFAVVATNAVSYQWQFEGAKLPAATNATLSLDDVNTNQAGAYTVVVTSADGTSVTNTTPAVLTVVPGTIVRFGISQYPGGVTNYVNVQLFDHDKPATVENFLHYIRVGAYTNLFWSRCVPGFVLQGGDYGADDRTNSSLRTYSIYEAFTVNLNTPPYFPFLIDNEFNVGPLIHNTFGTLAMAKQANNPDSASDAFFFNLGDNSADLDNLDGGFTVFGRILTGSNALAYFNGLSAPGNGLYNSGVAPWTALPVNYTGPASPADSNLFFVDFTFLTRPPVDTNPPTVELNYPANGTITTNADLVVTGTAADDVGLSRVVVNFSDSFGYNEDAFGGDATGTTNWSYDAGNLPPGTFLTFVVSQDGAGNLSTNKSATFTVPRFPFKATADGPGTIFPNLDGTNTAVGATIKLKATPGKGATFLNWTSGTTAFLEPSESFTMANGLELTAHFASNSIPGGISFTYPSANAMLTNPLVHLTGKIGAAMGSAMVTCQFFTESTGISVNDPVTVSGTNTWSFSAVDFNPGEYIVQAVARDASGQSTVISEKFTILSPLTVLTNGPGTTSIANGTYLEAGKKYTIKATPKAGSAFYNWSDGSTVSDNATESFTNSAGLTLLATFVNDELPDGSISFTYPPSLVLTDNFTVTGSLSPTLAGAQVTCQFFKKNVSVLASEAASVNGTTWSLAVSNLTQGAYTAVAVVTDGSGKQRLVSTQFTVNLFPNVAGTYDGLFFPSGSASATVAGRFTLTLSKNGAFSMKTILPDHTYAIASTVPASGAFYYYVVDTRGYKDYFGFVLDLTGGTRKVTGYAYIVSGGAYVYSGLLGYRDVTSLTEATIPATGEYVLDLQTTTNSVANGPTNDAFAMVSASSSGRLTVSGTLADNVGFSESVGVSKDGVWPLYAGLYQGRGLLLGWMTNQAGGGASGTVLWIKPAIRDTYYPGGVSIVGSVTGTNYVLPVAGTGYQIVFSGGTVSPFVTNSVTVNSAGQFVPAAGTEDKLVIAISNTGVLTGHFSNPATGRTLQFKGAFTSPSQGGSGFVLDSGSQTGLFEIGLTPP